MPRFWLVLCTGMALATACTSENATHRAVRHVSEYMREAYAEVDAQYHASPMPIRIRHISCLCDAQIEFEAHIYGDWRPVLLVGDDRAMRAFKAKLSGLPDGQAVTASILLTDRIYVSGTGMLFHTLYYVGDA